MRLLTTHGGLPRVSWGAVIAGVILSLTVYLILSVLGAAIGMSALSPLSRPNPLQGFGFRSGAYLIVMTVIAVFIGSYFAGRCAPVLGWLHGLLAWAVMILMVLYSATSLVGSAVSAAGSVASTGATVGAAANPSGAAGTLASSMTQRVQGAIASATAEAFGQMTASEFLAETNRCEKEMQTRGKSMSGIAAAMPKARATPTSPRQPASPARWCEG